MCTSRLSDAQTSSSLASPGTEVSYMTWTLVLATLSGMHLQEDRDNTLNIVICHTPLIQSIRSVTRAGASGELHLIGDNLPRRCC